MTDPDTDRPSSRDYHASPAPPSPRPSVASRASRSSLRREQERQEAPAQPRPASPASPVSPSSPLLPPATQSPFSPVFTLLASISHSSNRQTIHHPTVHYIFADDDPEVLTAALAHHHRGAYDDNDEEGESQPPDRGVLLDMEPTADGSGYHVACASSLTADWAVTSARVSRTEGDGGGVAAGLGSNLVLKIEGLSIEPSPGPLGKASTSETEVQSSGGSPGRQRQPAPAAEDYADLLQDFEKRMSTLRKVVEAAAARQRAIGDVGGHVLEGTARERSAALSVPDTNRDDMRSRGGAGQ